MSDFDVVLERLVTDQGFAAALAADPVRALAGYRLAPEEVALLRTQAGADPGGQHAVETRANQSSLFGMLSPLAGALPTLDGFAGSGTGSAAPTGGTGGGTPIAGLGTGGGTPIAGMGAGAATADLTADAPTAGLGPATGRTGIGSAVAGGAVQASGSVYISGSVYTSGSVYAAGSATGGPAGTGLAGAAQAGLSGQARIGEALPGVPPGSDRIGEALPGAYPAAAPEVPEGYRTRVDADGDGDWDRHTLRGRPDGGVDIMVDLNGDGRADFVGHDVDADGLVDVSDRDRDHDGFFEKRMYDDNGDGWMDRSVNRSR